MVAGPIHLRVPLGDRPGAALKLFWLEADFKFSGSLDGKIVSFNRVTNKMYGLAMSDPISTTAMSFGTVVPGQNITERGQCAWCCTHGPACTETMNETEKANAC